MESWSCVSGGNGFMSDESESVPDAIARGKNGLMGWELNTPCSFGSSVVCSSQEAIESQGFGELGFPEMTRKSLPDDSIKHVLSSKFGGVRMSNPVTSTPNAFSVEEESCSKLSCGDSSLTDLKLWRIGDHRDAKNFNSSKTTPIVSDESFIPAKRARAGGLSSSTPFCQVYGCKKDLSPSKEYHKRHKVCEIHSKAPKVIVNGIEQRFCQQCSRFHLLPEFDDDKRSCRRRLAGHNERRRKPHVGIHSGRTGRLFQSYNGSRFQGPTFTTSSFICEDILPSSIFHPQKYEANNFSMRIKLENDTELIPQSAIPLTNGHLLPKFPFLSHGFGNDYLPYHDKGVNVVTAGKISGHGNQYAHDIVSSYNIPCSLFQNTSIGSEDFTNFDTASTVQGLSEISNSGRALSLLSSQSQNSSSHSLDVPMAHPLTVPSSHAHYGVNQVSEKQVQENPQSSTSGVLNKFTSSGINSADDTHLIPVIISDNGEAVNYGINGMFQGSECINTKDHLSCEDGPTIDLLQLSSQLQRVEHQRRSLQVKQESDVLYGLSIT